MRTCARHSHDWCRRPLTVLVLAGTCKFGGRSLRRPVFHTWPFCAQKRHTSTSEFGRRVHVDGGQSADVATGTSVLAVAVAILLWPKDGGGRHRIAIVVTTAIATVATTILWPRSRSTCPQCQRCRRQPWWPKLGCGRPRWGMCDDNAYGAVATTRLWPFQYETILLCQSRRRCSVGTWSEHGSDRGRT